MADSTTPRSIRLTNTMDLDVTGGTLTPISGIEAVRQAVRIRLQFFKGEWFLDETLGTPWFQDILVKNPNPSLLTAIFRERILDTPGVKAVGGLSLSLDRKARKLAVTFDASCDFGDFDDSVELAI